MNQSTVIAAAPAATTAGRLVTFRMVRPKRSEKKTNFACLSFSTMAIKKMCVCVRKRVKWQTQCFPLNYERNFPFFFSSYYFPFNGQAKPVLNCNNV